MWLRQYAGENKHEEVHESLVRDKLTGNYKNVAEAMVTAQANPNQWILITGGGSCRYGWFE